MRWFPRRRDVNNAALFVRRKHHVGRLRLPRTILMFDESCALVALVSHAILDIGPSEIVLK